MFCSECGATAHGKFCSSCGTALSIGKKTTDVIPVPVGWSDLSDCEVLLAIPEVRDSISHAASQAKKRI
jgi:hypothetical protein